MSRTASQIASEIRKLWGSKVHYSARPYLDYLCGGCNGLDDEKSTVLYFLSNAATFNKKITPKAPELKAELKKSVGIK